MGRPKKPDPFKSCRKCGVAIVRKRFNGVLEDLGAFRKRYYCDRACMAAYQEGTIKVLNAKNSRRQSAKTVAMSCARCGRNTTRLNVHHKDENPLNNTPDNLESLCGSCHKLEHNRLAATPSTPGSRPSSSKRT